jgi:Holliday junction DNA helicase RuvA
VLAYIQGNITHKSPTHVVIECGGLGYLIQITLNTFSRIQHESQCKLHTHLHVAGGLQGPLSVQLFGFYEEAEKQMFLQLLDISGIGAATVRMILSSLSPEEIQRAIIHENAGLLESIKGIGPKTAKRIILELKDKVSREARAAGIPGAIAPSSKEEALSALIMLGFSRSQADQALSRILRQQGDLPAEELIRLALKNM